VIDIKKRLLFFVLVFSRPYFTNGRAVVMVVVRPSVRPSSVTDVLWLNGARYGLGRCGYKQKQMANSCCPLSCQGPENLSVK